MCLDGIAHEVYRETLLKPDSEFDVRQRQLCDRSMYHRCTGGGSQEWHVEKRPQIIRPDINRSAFLLWYSRSPARDRKLSQAEEPFLCELLFTPEVETTGAEAADRPMTVITTRLGILSGQQSLRDLRFICKPSYYALAGLHPKSACEQTQRALHHTYGTSNGSSVRSADRVARKVLAIQRPQSPHPHSISEKAKVHQTFNLYHVSRNRLNTEGSDNLVRASTKARIRLSTGSETSEQESIDNTKNDAFEYCKSLINSSTEHQPLICCTSQRAHHSIRRTTKRSSDILFCLLLLVIWSCPTAVVASPVQSYRIVRATHSNEVRRPITTSNDDARQDKHAHEVLRTVLLWTLLPILACGILLAGVLSQKFHTTTFQSVPLVFRNNPCDLWTICAFVSAAALGPLCDQYYEFELPLSLIVVACLANQYRSCLSQHISTQSGLLLVFLCWLPAQYLLTKLAPDDDESLQRVIAWLTACMSITIIAKLCKLVQLLRGIRPDASAGADSRDVNRTTNDRVYHTTVVMGGSAIVGDYISSHRSPV